MLLQSGEIDLLLLLLLLLLRCLVGVVPRLQTDLLLLQVCGAGGLHLLLMLLLNGLVEAR